MVPLAESFVVPFAAKHIKDGAFEPNDVQVAGTKAMLDELLVIGAPLAHLHFGA